MQTQHWTTTRRHIVRCALPTFLLLVAIIVAGMAATAPSYAAAATAPLSTQSDATLTVMPTSTAPGSIISVSGSGFTANESVSVTVSGQAGVLASVQADGSGNLPATSVTIPASLPGGSYTLNVTGIGGGVVVGAGLTINRPTPTLTLNPGSIEHGGMVVATGGGFAPTETVIFTLSGQSTALATERADGSGTLPPHNVTIPSTVPADSYTLTATGTSGGVAGTGAIVVLAPQWYVAGASNSTTVPSTLVLQNAQAQPALVQIFFYFANGETEMRNATVPAHGHLSIAVASLGVPRGTFGTEIAADRSIKAQMTVAPSGDASTTLQGAAVTTTTWKETAPTLSTLLGQMSILNPSTGAAQVHMLLVSGSKQRTVTISAPAHSDSVVNVAHLLGGLNGSLTVSSSRPLILAFS